MDNLNIGAVLKTCDVLARRIVTIGGEYHGSSFIFDKVMRAFEGNLPAEAITFSVFINSPVNAPGEATIHRDGHLEMRIRH